MRVIDKTNIEKIIVSSVSDDMNKFMHAMYWFLSGRKNKIDTTSKYTGYSSTAFIETSFSVAYKGSKYFSPPFEI